MCYMGFCTPRCTKMDEKKKGKSHVIKGRLFTKTTGITGCMG